MTIFFQTSWLFLLCFTVIGCNCQPQNTTLSQRAKNNAVIGGAFENREFTYYGIPQLINAVDTSPGWRQKVEKLLLTGIVYKQDGKTPAPGVLIYYYHTNTEGKYQHIPAEKRSMAPNSRGQTHGYIRGWVQTDSNGKYFIYTGMPGAYPTRDEPVHIHITVKEPNEIPEYYIDDFIFDDDPLVNASYRQKKENRAGSGILRLIKKDSLFIGERNIILGLHIPDYPEALHSSVQSGRETGEDVFSFTPYHSWGPDKGSTACPICKYGWYNGILFFAGNQPDWENIKKWISFLETESRKRRNYLKAFFIYGNENETAGEKHQLLEKLGQSLQLKNIALTYVPSFADESSEVYLNNIYQQANTIIVYKRSVIIDKLINPKASEKNFKKIEETLDKATNEFFYLENAVDK